jgi:uncharacterized protein (UPF0332 family)
MNFDDLLNNDLIEEFETQGAEIKAIIAAAKSDIKTARGLLAADTCWAFNIAYNSILEAGIAFMYSKGFRPSGEAKHISVILFLKRALGKEFQADLDRFNQIRGRRHKAVYGVQRNITEYEAKETIKFAERFVEEIIRQV